MKLLTKEVEKNIPPLYSQEGNLDPMVVVKFFSPYNAAVWYLTEGSPVDEHGQMIPPKNQKNVPYDRKVHSDFTFFGLCDLGLGFPELGYVSLSELESVPNAVERDMYFTPEKLSVFKKVLKY